MGGYEGYPCPSCGAQGFDEEDPFVWKGLVFGTGGNDRGSGSCMSCHKNFKIVGSPQLIEITIDKAAKLAEEFGFTHSL